jgi:hypothetical protein
MSHRLSEIIEGFDPVSYHAGANTAFAEVVGAGCKRLALSSPYDPGLAEKMMEPTRMAAETYGVELEVETDLLKSKLFPEDIAEGKTVIMIAQNRAVLDEYKRLKEAKRESAAKGHPAELELGIARAFGRLLSYSEEKIEALIERNG